MYVYKKEEDIKGRKLLICPSDVGSSATPGR